MNAREKFLKLGYEHTDHGVVICYRNKDNDRIINFNTKLKTVNAYDNRRVWIELTDEEVKAICEQCKESGYYD